MFNAEVIGVDQVLLSLDSLGKKVKGSIMNKALDEAAALILNALVDAAPISEGGVKGEKVDSRNHPAGTLRRSFSIIKSKGSGDYPTRYIRPRRTGDKDTDAWYAHLVEYEYSGHKNTKGSLGFIRRTVDAKENQVKDTMSQIINEEVSRVTV